YTSLDEYNILINILKSDFKNIYDNYNIKPYNEEDYNRLRDDMDDYQDSTSCGRADPDSPRFIHNRGKVDPVEILGKIAKSENTKFDNLKISNSINELIKIRSIENPVKEYLEYLAKDRDEILKFGEIIMKDMIIDI